jgi:hypothetical protein
MFVTGGVFSTVLDKPAATFRTDNRYFDLLLHSWCIDCYELCGQEIISLTSYYSSVLAYCYVHLKYNSISVMFETMRVQYQLRKECKFMSCLV